MINVRVRKMQWTDTSEGCWNSEKCFEFSKIENYVKVSLRFLIVITLTLNLPCIGCNCTRSNKVFCKTFKISLPTKPYRFDIFFHIE